jgi:hypothetical protein
LLTLAGGLGKAALMAHSWRKKKPPTLGAGGFTLSRLFAALTR